jgi:hypothetical protein
MDILSETLSAIRNTYKTRLRIPTIKVSEVRVTLGISSKRTLDPIVTLLKKLCLRITIELGVLAKCETDCQSSHAICLQQERLCETHLEWVQRFDALSSKQQDTQLGMFDEIDNCPDCNDVEGCPDIDNCIRACIPTPKNLTTLNTLSDRVSGIVSVDKDWIIFLIWYCYTQVCSNNMLLTSGILQHFLLGAQYEENILRLNREIRTFRSYSKCPLI